MATRKILVSWLGTYDIHELAKMEAGVAPQCALTSLVSSRQFGPFDELCLFVTRDLPITEEAEIQYASALKGLDNICSRYGTELKICWAEDNSRAGSPEKLYNFSLRQLEVKYPDHADRVFYYNITSGTALVGNIQFHLSQGSAFRGEALYTIDPRWLHPASSQEGESVYSVQLPDCLAYLGADTNGGDELYVEPNRKVYAQIKMKVANVLRRLVRLRTLFALRCFCWGAARYCAVAAVYLIMFDICIVAWATGHSFLTGAGCHT